MTEEGANEALAIIREIRAMIADMRSNIREQSVETLRESSRRAREQLDDMLREHQERYQ